MHDAAQRFDLPDGEAWLLRRAIAPALAEELFRQLRQEVDWRQEAVVLFGKRHLVPRLVAWYGDPGASYEYSGVAHDPRPWMPPLATLRERVEALTGHRFNGVLLNLSGTVATAWAGTPTTNPNSARIRSSRRCPWARHAGSACDTEGTAAPGSTSTSSTAACCSCAGPRSITGCTPCRRRAGQPASASTSPSAASCRARRPWRSPPPAPPAGYPLLGAAHG